MFSWNLSLGSFLSLPVFADGLGWLRLILGCPPSVAWRWRLLPWFLVRYLSACPREAAVPLDSLALRCSWSSTMGSPVSGLGLCSSSVHDCDVCFPSFWWVLPIGLSAGSPASVCRCVLWHALVLVAVPPSHGSVLLLRPGFLFSGPGWCGEASTVFLLLCLPHPLGSIVPFCHS